MTSFRIETMNSAFQEAILQPLTSIGVGTSITLNSKVPTDAAINIGNITIGNQPQQQDLNTALNFNTSIGFQALTNNGAPNNVAVGVLALSANEDGRCNTAIGSYSLSENKGSMNTGVGFSSLTNVTDGNSNTAVGNYSGGSVRSGEKNIIIGSWSDVSDDSSSNQIIIGNDIKATDSNQIILGNPYIKSCFVAGIRSVSVQPTSSLLGVYVNDRGQLTTISSSAKYKRNITKLGDEIDELYKLTPVSFNYDSDTVGDKKSFGLIARDVEKVFPDILARETVGSLKTVQYHLLIPLMLSMIIRLKGKVDEQSEQIKKLTNSFAR